MRAVIQRVSRASVAVGEEIVGSIGRGLCVLVGIHENDTDEDMEYLTRKILNVRIFEKGTKRWDISVKDAGFEILSVSQFTLYGFLKGNKMDFHRAMGPNDAETFYNKFLDRLKKNYIAEKIQDGRFAAMMSVDIVNDGPVTIVIDSKNRE